MDEPPTISPLGAIVQPQQPQHAPTGGEEERVATLPPRAHPSTEGMAQLLALARFSSPELSSIVYQASQQHESEPPRWRDSEH